jgi:2-haloacid dehalogenase
VVSGELGLIKPDAAIFHALLEKLGRPAEACMFIDDAPRNVAAAERLGFVAHRFVGPEALETELGALGLL